MSLRPGVRSLLFVSTLSVVSLYLGFSSNSWRVAEESWFHGFQRDTEALIVGRLVQSRATGVLSYGGLPGWDHPNPTTNFQFAGVDVNEPYRLYVNELQFGRYVVYKSQVGGQGIFLSMLDGVIPLRPATRLWLFRSANALLTALVLTAVVAWFHVEFGIAPALFVLAGALSSQWLTVFGRNLWWSTWAFFLPMALMLWLLRAKHTWTAVRPLHVGAVALAGLLVKCLFNGYEYITTAIVMMSVPIVYGGVRDRMGVGRLAVTLTSAAVGAAMAVLSTAVVLCVQIASLDGNMTGGIRHIADALYRRTYRRPRATEDWQMGLGPTLTAYLNGTFVELPLPKLLLDFFGWESPVYRLLYWHLFLGFAAASALVLVAIWRAGPGDDRRRLALVAATWFSLLAPLSWFAIFRSHSRSHPHMNFILWQMPFTLWGFAVCGVAVMAMVDGLFSRRAHDNRADAGRHSLLESDPHRRSTSTGRG